MNPRILPILLAGTTAVASAGLIVELRRPPADFSPPPAPAVGLETQPAPVSTLMPLSVSALEARPLFTPDRRPPKPVPVAAPVAAAPPPSPPAPPPPEPGLSLTLLGIVDGPEGRIAIIREKAGGEVARATEGSKIDRWELHQITSDHVVLVIDGTTQRLGFPPPNEGRSKHGAERPSNPPPRRP
jgi:hypothetical protein